MFVSFIQFIFDLYLDQFGAAGLARRPAGAGGRRLEDESHCVVLSSIFSIFCLPSSVFHLHAGCLCADVGPGLGAAQIWTILSWRGDWWAVQPVVISRQRITGQLITSTQLWHRCKAMLYTLFTRQSAEAAATTKLPAAGIGLLSVIQHSSLLEEMYLQMIKRIKQKWIQLKLLPQIL